MKPISHSEANIYLDCAKKWKLIYKLGIKKSSIHTEFGEMAHKVLETRVIPEEHLYPHLKLAFNISSWEKYFSNIFTEIDKILNDYEIVDRELKIIDSGISGVIDIVARHKKLNTYTLFDYKFTSTPKEYSDIYLDEQLKIYAYLLSRTKWIDIEKIKVGYISIPKAELQSPIVLRNGTLSKNKSQYTTKELYLQAIKDLNLKVEDYEDILNSLPTYIKVISSLVSKEDVDKVIKNLHEIRKASVERPILEHFNSFKCKSCEYLKECKYDNKNS